MKKGVGDKKIIAVIQSRMGSKRLPRKATLRILGKTLIEWIVYRLSFAKEIDGVILATSDTKENDELADLAQKIGLPFYRGSEQDLISRLLQAADVFGADAIVRITGDCPLVDPEIVDRLVSVYRNSGDSLDYVTNTLPPTYPDGMDVEVISRNALKRLDQEVKSPLYREWLTTTFMENPQLYKVESVRNSEDLSGLRLTVDYPEDFKLVEAIFSKLHRDGSVFGLPDILKLFKKESELKKINENRIDKAVLNNIRSGAFHELKKNNE